MILRPLAALLVIPFAPITPALAWGYEGHRTVADIVEQYLEPATAKQVRPLLAIENETTLADAANWPIRSAANAARVILRRGPPGHLDKDARTMGDV